MTGGPSSGSWAPLRTRGIEALDAAIRQKQEQLHDLRKHMEPLEKELEALQDEHLHVEDDMEALVAAREILRR